MSDFVGLQNRLIKFTILCHKLANELVIDRTSTRYNSGTPQQHVLKLFVETSTGLSLMYIDAPKDPDEFKIKMFNCMYALEKIDVLMNLFEQKNFPDDADYARNTYSKLIADITTERKQLHSVFSKSIATIQSQQER